jgi:hypothetical protein
VGDCLANPLEDKEEKRAGGLHDAGRMGLFHHLLREDIQMKWFYLIAVILAAVLIVALVPDHMHGMIYAGSGFLILSYIFIPRRPQLGWIASLTGNAMYLLPVSQLHRIDLMVVPAVFTALSLWNVWHELTKALKN